MLSARCTFGRYNTGGRKEERIALIKSWIPDDDGLQDCEIDLWDMYADYINGKREIAEINMAFQADYIQG